MADEVKSIDTRTNEGFARVGAEFKSVRAEIVAGGQATSADKVSYGDKTVQQALDDLNYKAIAINSFTNDVGTVDMGSTVTDVTLSYSFNKTAKSLTLDGTAIDVASTKQVLTGLTITANKTYTLTATDDRDAKATKTTSISFLNGCYYGVGTVDVDGADKAFVAGLTKVLSGSRARTIDVTAGEGEFIYYAIPHRLGTPSFTVGGFEGGFSLLKTFDYENPAGYTESYDVYKSTNANLGATKVVIA